jgi:hypothetical protein
MFLPASGLFVRGGMQCTSFSHETGLSAKLFGIFFTTLKSTAALRGFVINLRTFI